MLLDRTAGRTGGTGFQFLVFYRGQWLGYASGFEGELIVRFDGRCRILETR